MSWSITAHSNCLQIRRSVRGWIGLLPIRPSGRLVALRNSTWTAMRGEWWCCCDLFPSLCRGDLGNECTLIDMLLIDSIQAKLRMQSMLGVGCLEMTKFRRRHTFRWAQVPAKDMFVLYFISQGNVVGISALDQGHTSCFLGLLFSVCVYELLTPFTLYDAHIEIF